MTSQTQLPRNKLPGTRPVLRKLEVTLPAPPADCRDSLPALELYVFDSRRRFLGKAPFDGDRTKLEGDLGPARTLRAIVAPRGLSPETVARSGTLPALTIESPGQSVIEFPHNWWEGLLLGQLAFYHGRVEKVLGSNTLPIREGIVEVYEIDPWAWIVKLPDLDLLHFRDDLLARLDPLQVPELFVDPRPGPDPGPELSLLNESLRNVSMAHTPVVMGAARPLSNVSRFSAPAAATPINLGLPPQMLKSLQGDGLRNWLLQNKQALLPLLSFLLPDWWYHKAKLGEVAIKSDGTFSGFAGWWLPDGDKPDLYFRVRQMIEGVDKTIYSPKICGHTWWNYSGEEIVLRVTDPQAVAVDDSLVAQDDQVVFLGVGFDTTTDSAGAAGLVQSGTDKGMFRHASGKLAPYGHVLHFVLDVDLYGLKAAGVSFYRLSWQRGAQNSLGNASSWTPLTTPINRHYREVKTVGGNLVVSYPIVSLVPAPADVPAALTGKEGIFRFADPVRDYVVIDSTDRAFGIWDTTGLQSASLGPADVADTYTLRLEVFNSSGADITATTPVLRIHKQEADESYSTTTLDSGKPFLFVHIDNQPMVAEINDTIVAGTTTTGTGCGFLVAGSNADVQVGIRAFHPGGVGQPGDPDRFIHSWNYNVMRGSAATNCVSANVTDKNVGSSAAWQAVPYAPDVPVQSVNHLLTGVTPFGEQRRCTFTVQLEAYTLTRNGYDRLAHLDRADHAAFALIERNA